MLGPLAPMVGCPALMFGHLAPMLGYLSLVLSFPGCPAPRLGHLVPLRPAYSLTKFRRTSLFGDPCTRGISKLVSRIMQITLKVKSGESIGGSSPTITLLSGAERWPVMYLDGSSGEHTRNSRSRVDLEATPSLWEISHCPLDRRLQLSENCIYLCSAETGVILDPMEFEGLVQLVYYISSGTIEPNQGISVATFMPRAPPALRHVLRRRYAT
jgi:hypothetical protein